MDGALHVAQLLARRDRVNAHLLTVVRPQQQVLLAAKINTATGPGTGPKKKSPGPVRTPATTSGWNFKTSRERAMGLEPTTSSLGSWHSTN